MTNHAVLLQEINTLPAAYVSEVIDFVAWIKHSKIRQELPSHIPESRHETKEPLSKQFAGALRLSDSAYEALQVSLQEGRSEWNRDIF